MEFNYQVQTVEGLSEKTMDLSRLIVVGFAGRDIEKTMEHIRELEEEGIPAPATVPVVYECDPHIITTDSTMRVIGDKTSGEVEYLILLDGDKTYIGLGSDHTDRALETVSIHKSKQLCLKPYVSTFWDLDEIREHFYELELRATQVLDGEEIEYQEGTTADLLPLERIIEEVRKDTDPTNSLIYSGTVPLKAGFKYGQSFGATLSDRKLDRELRISYDIEVIPEH